MNGLGTHILIDLYGCDPSKLSDLEFLKQMSLEGVRRSGATILGECFKRFETQGVSGVVIIAESHFTLHSWPEHSYIGMDYFTCGDRIDIDVAIRIQVSLFDRCRKPNARIEIVRHDGEVNQVNSAVRVEVSWGCVFADGCQMRCDLCFGERDIKESQIIDHTPKVAAG